MNISNQEEAFHRAIQENPDDDTVRLVFADWLEERGDLRGELIRVQYSLRALGLEDVRRESLQERSEALCSAETERLKANLGILLNNPVFDRGFISEASVRATEFAKHAESIFRFAPALKSIDLGDAVGRSEIETLALSPHLAHISGLSFMTAHKSPRQPQGGDGDGCIQALCSSPYLSSLRKLEIPRSRVSPQGVQLLASSPAFAQLTHLRLWHNNISDLGVDHLTNSPHLSQLKRLNLAANYITPEGIRSFTSHPSFPFGELTDLDFSYNEVGPEGARLLAVFPHLHNLVHLRLQVADIGDAGVEALIESEHRRHCCIRAEFASESFVFNPRLLPGVHLHPAEADIRSTTLYGDGLSEAVRERLHAHNLRLPPETYKRDE